MSDTRTTTHAYNKPQQDKATQTVLIVGSVITTTIAVLLLLGLCIIQLWVMPRFLEIFQDFDTQLPALTILLLEIPTAIYLAAYGLGMVGLIAMEFIPPLHRSIKLALNLIVIVLCLIMYVAYFLGLQLPMVTLMDSMM